ncbi:hypothetical protein BC834DRAFT_886603 [Gloeopeniophorella convolvens]|nr:hypothetical protein BC834DRAFT_886603 [Gloeopeniophorella convolvens]
MSSGEKRQLPGVAAAYWRFGPTPMLGARRLGTSRSSRSSVPMYGSKRQRTTADDSLQTVLGHPADPLDFSGCFLAASVRIPEIVVVSPRPARRASTLPISRSKDVLQGIRAIENGGASSDPDEEFGSERDSETAMNSRSKVLTARGYDRIQLTPGHPSPAPRGAKQQEAEPQNERPIQAVASGFPSTIQYDAFHSEVIGAFVLWIAHQDDPWATEGRESCRVLQFLCRAVFPDFDEEVTTDSAVYRVANQYVADSYRSAMDSAAIKAVAAVLRSPPAECKTAGDCAAFADHMLEKHRYIYGELGAQPDQDGFKYAYENPTIIEVMAVHTDIVKHAAKCEEVEATYSRQDPHGALALATITVQKAWMFWWHKTVAGELPESGTKVARSTSQNKTEYGESTAMDGFNGSNRARHTRQCRVNISRVLPRDRMVAILTAAEAFGKKRKSSARAFADSEQGSDESSGGGFADVEYRC